MENEFWNHSKYLEQDEEDVNLFKFIVGYFVYMYNIAVC